ncbi:MAG: L,D-transpeptidase family protein [Desulfobacterales bacterium]|uniref:L,D-transpeptidase family protein n=1 Tax=Candidatus Desulfaltia bathyphila TaxID=2841697 RepID=A0A8J6N4T1_9BACT|nr:L,D-transpeptidase family protein [Candidatus Desulfaltia bathyphila]MBL7196013.1 L,D-transpeptidase family protein [Desulfobacterales bacterium]MBL7207435.1 L,D-transpeptidase family protein [Desulfobacterales bacterium]
MARYIQMRIFYTWLAVIMLPVISSGVSASQHKEAGLKAVASRHLSRARAPDVLISFDNDSSTKYAMVVEKETQQLLVYSYDDYDDSFKEMSIFKCSTGEMAGGKLRSGDKKTPEGVYFFTNEHKKRDLSPIYGNKAFPIDYPNFFDRIEGRRGHSIWLHGTNQSIKARDSNGCVVLANQDIDKLAKYIVLHKTPIIIVDKLSYASFDDKSRIKSSIFNFLKQWNHALENGTYHEYLECYAPEYLPDISWWTEWNKVKKIYSASNLDLSVGMKRRSILRHNGVYVILFDQFVRSSGKDLHAGSKKLYLADKGGYFRIVGEECHGASTNQKNNNPLVSAGLNLKRLLKGKYEIANFVDGWLKAWSAKDIKRYGSYYSCDFRFQGMNLKAWLNYKARLNRKYDFIHVSKDDMIIQKGKNKITVSFTQTYTSSAFKAKGIKKLILIQGKGGWKIFRETWQKL